jgi:hypothetical protein
MVELMTRWARLVLATAAMILAGSGAPVVERMMTGDGTAVQAAVAGADNMPDAVVATRDRARFFTPTVRLVPMAVAVVLVAGSASIHRRRRGRWGGLRLRLEDVGDRWRALLLGAPPAVL